MSELKQSLLIGFIFLLIVYGVLSLISHLDNKINYLYTIKTSDKVYENVTGYWIKSPYLAIETYNSKNTIYINTDKFEVIKNDVSDKGLTYK